MKVEFQSPNGSFRVPLLNKEGFQRVLDAHGRHFDAAENNRLFVVDSDAVTLAAANATKGALGTAKLINGIFNPNDSGVNAEILYAIVVTVSGTPAGGFFWNYFSGITINNAATGAIRRTKLSSKDSSKIIPEVNVVLTTVGGATNNLLQLAPLGGPAAIAAGAGMYSVVEDVAGKIIVPPGTVFGITGTGAGTTHIVQSAIYFQEVDI
jgi:hypothetical protein